jgi:uncharacterized protein (UPF0305 family)
MGSAQGRSLLQKYQKVASSLTKSKDERAIKKIFKKYDHDQDGKLNKEEALFYIKDVLDISGLAKQIWDDAIYLDSPQKYFDDLLEAVYNRMDESRKGYIDLPQLIKPNQEFYEFLNSTAEMLEHQFQKQIFEKAIQKDIDEVKKACKDLDFIKSIQFESVNEVNKIKFVMQPKSDFQFDFFIRIPHDFPYGYLKCSMPRDAETMNLDYLDILERIENDVNEACKKKEISIGDLFKLFLTELTQEFSLNLPRDFKLESLKQIWKAQNADLSDSEIEIGVSKTPLHVDAIEAECVFGHKVTFIQSVNVVRFAIDAMALPSHLADAFGIKDKSLDHALISVQFDENYLLSSKPPTVKLLPRIVQEKDDGEENSASPTKAEAKKKYLDTHLNMLFSSVMLLIVQHYMQQRWPTILSTEMPEVSKITPATVYTATTPEPPPPVSTPAAGRRAMNRFAAKKAAAKKAPAKLTVAPKNNPLRVNPLRPIAAPAPVPVPPNRNPLFNSSSEESSSEKISEEEMDNDSEDSIIITSTNNGVKVESENNGPISIKLNTGEDLAVKIDGDLNNTNNTNTNNNNTDYNNGANDKASSDKDESDEEPEEKEPLFGGEFVFQRDRSETTDSVTEDDKEDESVFENLDNTRVVGFLRTSVYDLKKLINTEAQKQHQQDVQEVREWLERDCKQVAIAKALSKMKLNPSKAMELYIDAGGEVEVVEKLHDLTERQKLTDWKYKNFLLELGCYLSFAVAQLGGYCLVCGQEVANATRAAPLNICTRPTCRYFHWRFFRDIPISISCSSVAPEILSNPNEVDLLITLCYSAASSNRANLIFSPKPPDMEAHQVVTLLDSLPPVAELKEHCSSEGSLKEFLRQKNGYLFEQQYKFLFWLLGVDRGRLIRLPFHKRLHVMYTKHQYIMTVICEPERRLKFEEARKKYGSFFAYHGSGMDNWHAIVRSGLKNVSNTSLMTSGAAFGPGVYLAAESDTSFGYARQGSTWRNSKWGGSGQAFCLAIVEVAKAPGVPTIPKPYYVVQDDQYVMPRVFLFYTGKRSWARTPRIGAKALNLHTYFNSQDVLF